MKRIFKLIGLVIFIINLSSCSQVLDEYTNNKNKKYNDREMINYKSNNTDNNRIIQQQKREKKEDCTKDKQCREFYGI